MATSPNYSRQTSNPGRALANTALDFLSDALFIVDAAHSHLLIAFINVAARECMGFDNNSSLTGLSLSRLLIETSIMNADLLNTLAADIGKFVSKLFKWNLAGGQQFVATELRGWLALPANIWSC